MPAASYQQTNFLGGEWSPFYQGRADHPNYRSAMNRSLNGYPIEEGAWLRRQGTRLLAPTFKGQAGKLYPLFFTETAPYTVEFTDGNIRFFNGAYPVITEEVQSVGAISTANPAVVTLTNTVTWATDDEVAFVFNNTSEPGSTAPQLRQRTFLITIVPETYSAWSSSTNYGSGSIVSYSGNNYTSLQAGNLNKQPDTQTAWWRLVGSASSRKFSLRDAITGVAVDGSTITGLNTFLGISCLRSLRLATPYTAGTWEKARIVQNEDIALVLNGLNIPQALSITPNLTSTQAAAATIKPVIFHDGPYLLPVENTVATLSGVSGVVTVTVKFAAYDAAKTYAIGDYVTDGSAAYKSLVDGNLANTPASSPADWIAVDIGTAVTGPGYTGLAGFQATDVGRLMRFFSQPDLWNGGNYLKGDKVRYNDVAYTAIADNSAVQPDMDPTIWSVNPTGMAWTWGKITAVTNSNTVTLQILGDPLLYALPVTVCRLGIYSDTTGWPTCGVFYAGRFWFGGAIPNQFDATEVDGVTADGVVNMAPTLPDGTVTDSSAISYKFDADDKNPIFWFSLDHQGIIAGTKGGEWLIQSSATGAAITPTSIQAHRVTRYKCADIEPKHTGVSLVFVQAFKRRVMEFLADVFTGRFIAPNLSETSKHLTQSNVEEIAYQEELAPILWCRTGAGKLIGATYRRRSTMVSQAPEFIGWHQHQLGHLRAVESIAVGPNADGSLDALAMVSNDTTQATPVRWVEQLTLMFDEEDSLFDAWFLDGAIVPDGMYEDTVAGVTGQRITGLWYLSGKSVSVFLAGLDVGDFTVDTNGTIFIPYGSGVAPTSIDYQAAGAGAYLFTAAYVAYVKGLNLNLKNGGILLNGDTTITKTVIVTNPNNTSKVQNLQPVEAVRSDALIVDWSTGKALLNFSHNSWSVMNMISGAEIQNKTVDAIMGETGDGNGTAPEAAADVDSHGNMYANISSLTANVLKADTLTLTKIMAGGNGTATGFPQSSSLAVIEANSEFIVSVGSTRNIAIGKGTDATLLAGNFSTDPGYMGYNQTEWTLETAGGLIAGGAPTHGGNVASSYIIQTGLGWPATFSYFFIGAADGVPSGGGNTTNNGSTGKKGKGKKGAFDGGVNHTPTVDNPLVYFGKIGDLPVGLVDARWPAFGNWDGCIVDESDNSVITYLGVSLSGISAWSNVAVYVAGDLVTKSSKLYYAKLPSQNVDPDTDTTGAFPATGTFWDEVPKRYLVSVTTGQYSRSNTGAFGLKWVVPLNEDPTLGNSMAQGRLKGGLFGYISATHDAGGQTVVYLVDTTTGKYFVGVMPGIDQLGRPQAWDDLSQSFVCYGSYTSTVTGAPTALNSTVTFSNNWMRLYVGNLTLSTHIKSTLTIQPNGYTFVYTDTNGGSFPALVGATYTSQGQILRPIAPEQSGTRTGPAFGKIRRSHLIAALLKNTIGIMFGTDFTTKGMLPATIKHEETTGALYTPDEMYSGFWRDPLENGYDFDSMLAWQITRPYPATVVSVGAFIKTQD